MRPRCHVLRLHALERRPEIGDILIAQVAVEGIGKGRVIGGAIRGHTLSHGAGEIVYGPGADTRRWMRGDIGRHETAKVRFDRGTTGQGGMTGAGIGMAGDATTGPGKIGAAPWIALALRQVVRCADGPDGERHAAQPDHRSDGQKCSQDASHGQSSSLRYRSWQAEQVCVSIMKAPSAGIWPICSAVMPLAPPVLPIIMPPPDMPDSAPIMPEPPPIMPD